MKNESNYCSLGEVCCKQLKQQAQYGCQYADPGGAPFLAEGLRIQGEASDYHRMTIHVEDVAEFVRRVREYRIDNQIVDPDHYDDC